MDELMTKEESITDVLAHHGILGMKWGKKNGPPYPLDDDISTGKRLRKEAKAKAKAEAKKKKAASKRMKAYNKKKQKIAKWKEKISRDPEKMLKNADKFTDKEIDAAINKIYNKNSLKEAVTSDRPIKLSARKKILARNAESLYKHRNQFTDAEMDLALNKIRKDAAAMDAKNYVEAQKQERARDALRTISTASDAAGSVIRTVGTVALTGSNFTEWKRKKMQLQQERYENSVENMFLEKELAERLRKSKADTNKVLADTDKVLADIGKVDAEASKVNAEASYYSEKAKDQKIKNQAARYDFRQRKAADKASKEAANKASKEPPKNPPPRTPGFGEVLNDTLKRNGFNMGDAKSAADFQKQYDEYKRFYYGRGTSSTTASRQR